MTPHPPVTPLIKTGNASAYHTTRGACTPAEPYSGFNLCHYTGDDPAHSGACRDSLAEMFEIPSDRIIIPRQTHSTNVATITAMPVSPDDIENVDAVVTNQRGLIIGVNTADCVPVVLLDPKADIYAVAHAGWRGAVSGIVENTVKAMLSLGSSPRDILAAIGPSICVGCFEVGDEVASRFPADCVSREPGQKPHVSLQKHITKILSHLSLRQNNIYPFDPASCTRCHPDLYWSARRMGINSGRIYTFVVIK